MEVRINGIGALEMLKSLAPSFLALTEPWSALSESALAAFLAVAQSTSLDFTRSELPPALTVITACAILQVLSHYKRVVCACRSNDKPECIPLACGCRQCRC